MWAKLTLTRMLEKELVVLHLKVSWRSWPCVRSGLGLWNSMQVMPFQSAALTAWASSAMLGDVWGAEGVKKKRRWNHFPGDTLQMVLGVRD